VDDFPVSDLPTFLWLMPVALWLKSSSKPIFLLKINAFSQTQLSN
jgi:hypothetical protein